MAMNPLRPAYETRRLTELVGALGRKTRANARNSWSRAEIEVHQRRRLAAVVAHAAARSRFYADLYRSVPLDGRIDLARLPVVAREDLMGRFDDWVTDPVLTLNGAERHLETFAGPDGYYLGRYRILTTSGSSGRRGVFAFSGREWLVLQAQLMRFMDGIGVGFRPRLGPRMRAAAIFAGRPLHITFRLGASMDIGAEKVLRLPATTPLPELVRALNEFQPDWLHAYPSTGALLAWEQLSGALRIQPRAVSTVGEVRTAEMAERMTAAWGHRPFDMYWMTEGGTGMECDHHRMHLIDDEVLMEVVDEENRPVPPGEQGHKVLITNLYMRTQPIIRCEVPDLLTPSAETCPCGRPYPVLASVDGRRDDVLHLADGRGGRVPIHPIAFRSPFASEPEVRAYQVVERDDGLLVKVVPTEGIDREALRARIGERVQQELQAAGAARQPLAVELVGEIERDARQMGKVKLIRSEVRRAVPA
jgi:phenylacetate-CoA ligase